MQLIECIPNISEGRDGKIIEQIIQSALGVEGAYLLHKDIGADVNRTVLTIVGTPLAACNAAFNVIAKTSELIDMRNHTGSHPRIGATDVCPIIPLANITMLECVELSKQLASRLGHELGIPIYLYGESAQIPERKSLAYIRGGEYEKLFLRIDELLFKPDFGPIVCNPRFGATAIGAEPSYIAYNVHLSTTDIQIAKAIAAKIRQLRQYYSNNSVDRTGAAQNTQVTWQECQAIGWYIDEYKCCQISLNLLDYKKTSLHQAFIGIFEFAEEVGIKVTGSEIIGLAPLQSLRDTGQFILDKEDQKDNKVLDEIDLINAAIKFLKLDLFNPFKIEEKVLEYRLAHLGLSLTSV